MIVDALRKVEQAGLSPTPQPENGVSYANKISKEEAAIDFSLPARLVSQKIRAFNPFPGASAAYDSVVLKLWRAEEVDIPSSANAGQVLTANANDGVIVACGTGAIRVLELQKPGGKRLPVAEFLKGFAIESGSFR
jgi:methionyl-tRNA formyltransferase